MVLAGTIGTENTMTTTNRDDLTKITEALQLLDQRISDNDMMDPGLFAGDIYSHILTHHDEWLDAICPDEAAAARKALAAFKREYPAIANDGRNSFWGHQETMLAYALSLYDAGLRHGASYEHLRRSVVGDVGRCRECWGAGITKDGNTCTSCGGTGTIALKP